ncbi:hypothetical protein B0H66DRAFT_75142 [Apodospora peruviana]|uniref:Uncharacterized protein n=1 Tax=Apodospora peruviana TaxID=516989 RepID=A0AAE0MFL8_9PEZI|nr:hypothetical protein B0H66DRAFT_75142 [Apodospora peruviana]
MDGRQPLGRLGLGGCPVDLPMVAGFSGEALHGARSGETPRWRWFESCAKNEPLEHWSSSNRPVGVTGEMEDVQKLPAEDGASTDKSMLGAGGYGRVHVCWCIHMSLLSQASGREKILILVFLSNLNINLRQLPARSGVASSSTTQAEPRNFLPNIHISQLILFGQVPLSQFFILPFSTHHQRQPPDGTRTPEHPIRTCLPITKTA